MTIFGDLLKSIYASYRQYLYTSLALAGLVQKRLTHGQEYFAEYEYPEPECVGDSTWHHKYAQLATIRMHYVEEGPPDGDVVLMVHGFPEFWYSWRFQLRHFAKTRRCIAIDMRGYNLTDKPTGISNYNVKYLVEDIRQFIEVLGLKRITLAAHDWGAIVCWRFAMLHPDIIDRLVILNVPHPVAFCETYKKSEEQRAKSWYIYLFQSTGVPELAIRANRMEMLEKMFRGRKAGIRNRDNFTDEDMLAWKHVFSGTGTTGPLNYYRELLKSEPIPKDKMIVQPPVLIIWGDEDAFLDKAGAEASIKYCRECSVHFVAGASHWVQQDNPEHVNRLIEQFVHATSHPTLTTTRTIDKSKL